MNIPIERFEKIADGIYRGAQPSPTDLSLLASSGFKTVINLRHEMREASIEKEDAEKAGLRYVHLPWRIQKNPKEDVMSEFLSILSDENAKPIFFHCRRGAERTGVATAVFYHQTLGMGVDEAYAKAMDEKGVLFYWRMFARKRFDEFLARLNDNPK